MGGLRPQLYVPHVSSSSWLCVGELLIQQVHKVGQERICGRHEAAAWNKKWDVWDIQLGIRLLWCPRFVGF